MKIGLCAVFFVSGLAGLLFETLWFRQAGLVFGNGVWAASLVLSSFMAGLALGNGLAAGLGDRVKRPLYGYAVIELVIALGGIALVALLPHLSSGLAPLLRASQDQLALLNSIRFVLAFTLLLLPSVAMGATLPLLVGALSRDERDFGSSLGLLYGCNTLGAVLGAVAPELFLIERLGVMGSAWVAGAANVVVAITAFLLGRALHRRSKQDAPAHPPDAPPTPPHAAGRWTLTATRQLVAAALAGFALLALEVVWFRFLLLFVAGTTRSFALMLAVVLAGIGVGGLLAAAIDRRFPRAYRHAWLFALAAGVCGVTTFAGFGWALAHHGRGFAVDVVDVLRLAVTLMGPVSVLSGVLFTLLGRGLRDEVDSTSRSAGLVTLANTLGSALGPLVAGFFLLPVLGMERSIFVLVAIYGAVGLASARLPVSTAGRAAAIVTAAAFVGAMFAFPTGRMDESYLARVLSRYEAKGARIVAMREGPTETIHYARYDFLGEPISYQLITNGFSMSASGLLGRRYMSLFVHLPAAIHGDLKDVLLISYGVGTTARALVETPSVERIDVVDISRDVLELSPVVHGAADPLADPRVRIHVEDGRHYLQTTDRRFDLITGEPPPLKYAGVEYLYTREYFALARDRLSDGGLISYWLPVYQLDPPEFRAVIAAFCDAFDDCSLWNGNGLEWILLGSRGARAPTEAEFETPWRQAGPARSLKNIGVERPDQLGATFMAGPGELRALAQGTPPLEDDHPLRVGNRLPKSLVGLRLYSDLMDPANTKRRFERSALIARLWPRELRARTLFRFDEQTLVNDFFMGRLPTSTTRRLQQVDRLLEETTLETLPLWLLGAEDDQVKVAERLAASGRVGPKIDYRLAARALSERDAERALPPLRRAWSTNAAPPTVRPALAYALARSGRFEELSALENETRGQDRDAPGLWQWLRRRFTQQ